MKKIMLVFMIGFFVSSQVHASSASELLTKLNEVLNETSNTANEYYRGNAETIHVTAFGIGSVGGLFAAQLNAIGQPLTEEQFELYKNHPNRSLRPDSSRPLPFLRAQEHAARRTYRGRSLQLIQLIGWANFLFLFNSNAEAKEVKLDREQAQALQAFLKAEVAGEAATVLMREPTRNDDIRGLEDYDGEVAF